MQITALWCVLLVCLLAQPGFSGTRDFSSVRFSIRPNAAQYMIGTPILIKVTLRNEGSENYQIWGRPGWGKEMGIRIAEVASSFKQASLDLHVPHADTDIGAAYIPPFFFAGDIATNNEQCLLLMVRTDGFPSGRLRLEGVMRQGTNELHTQEVTVLLSEAKKDEKSAVIDAAARNRINKQVAQLHNFFGAFMPEPALPHAYVQQLIDSPTTSIDVEYGLYGAVLEGVARNATEEHREVAKGAAKVFLERFPDSWLCAQTCAVLYMIYQKEGNTNDAQRAMRQGLSLPESQPLFQTLGLVPKSYEKGHKPK